MISLLSSVQSWAQLVLESARSLARSLEISHLNFVRASERADFIGYYYHLAQNPNLPPKMLILIPTNYKYYCVRFL